MFPKVKANKALKTCKRILIFTRLLRVSVAQENNPHIFTDYSVTWIKMAPHPEGSEYLLPADFAL